MQFSCILPTRRPLRGLLGVAIFAVAALSLSCTEPMSNDGLEPEPPTPEPIPGDTLAVAPQDVRVAVGQAIVFTASDTTMMGAPASGPVEWSVTGGSGATIDASGLFRASDTGTYTVRAGRGGKGGRSRVTVDQGGPSLTSVRVAPGSVSLQPGASFTFSATGRQSDGTDVAVSVDWSATGGTIDSAGRYRAGSTTGSFRVLARQRGGSLADSATVTIAAGAPTLQAIELTPASVTLPGGATQQFAAVGRMSDGSTAGVTVTWSATGGTVNGSGLFTAGGTAGNFRVIATNGTLADTASVTVTVRTLTSLSITPASVSLAPAGEQQFSATATWSDGGTTLPAITWTATGGGVSSSGYYVAGTTPGSYRVIATASGRADTSAITIATPPPSVTLTAIELTPAAVTLQGGATQQFAAVGRMSDGSSAGVTVTWSASGGTVNGSGLYTAGSTAGTYRVIATNGTLADTSNVTVTVRTLTSLSITPASVSLVPAGEQQFSATATWSDGSTTLPAITWTATGGGVSSNGYYVAGTTPGSYRVIATASGRSDTSAVTITTPAPTLTAIEVTPASVSLAGGAAQQFNAVGRMSDGSTTGVSVTWSATGGTVSSSGLYTSGSTGGTYRVIASNGALADTASVTILVRTLTSLIMTPASVSLAQGASQQFAVAATWSDGTTTLPAITWSATGGTVSTGGLYTAGGTAGSFRVIASGGGLADTSGVTITPPAPTLTAIEVSPATVSVATGGTQAFTAVGRLSDGSTSSVSVTWSATGGSVTAGGLYTAPASAGSVTVRATQQGGGPERRGGGDGDERAAGRRGHRSDRASFRWRQRLGTRVQRDSAAARGIDAGGCRRSSGSHSHWRGGAGGLRGGVGRAAHGRVGAGGACADAVCCAGRHGSEW